MKLDKARTPKPRHWKSRFLLLAVPITAMVLIVQAIAPDNEKNFGDSLKQRVLDGKLEIRLGELLPVNAMEVCLQAFAWEHGQRFKSTPWAAGMFTAERGLFDVDEYKVWQLAVRRADGSIEKFEVSRTRVPVLAQTFDSQGNPKSPLLEGNVLCAPATTAALRQVPGLKAYALVDLAK